jgi:phosphatidylserine/phosphatidylglycerophosphate/cardiolipin synthase-like enzyme
MNKLIIALGLLLACGKQNNAPSANNQCPEISVKFSPNGGATQAIVDNIDSANDSVRLHGFSFTSKPIAEALVRAYQKGRSVEVVVDRDNLRNEHSVLPYLNDNNISIWIDSRHAIAHNKVIIIDNKITFTGSQNFSRGGEENNAENSIRIVDEQTASLYYENFNLHRQHSKVYSRD